MSINIVRSQGIASSSCGDYRARKRRKLRQLYVFLLLPSPTPRAADLCLLHAPHAQARGVASINRYKIFLRPEVHGVRTGPPLLLREVGRVSGLPFSWCPFVRRGIKLLNYSIKLAPPFQHFFLVVSKGPKGRTFDPRFLRIFYLFKADTILETFRALGLSDGKSRRQGRERIGHRLSASSRRKLCRYEEKGGTLMTWSITALRRLITLHLLVVGAMHVQKEGKIDSH